MVNKVASGRIRTSHPDNQCPVAVASQQDRGAYKAPCPSGCEPTRQRIGQPDKVQRLLPLQDGPESRRERLLRVLAGVPSVHLGSALTFTEHEHRRATKLATSTPSQEQSHVT
jgi:hypothetical protein